MSYQDLSTLDIAIAAALMLVNGLLSVFLRLGLARQLLVASLRTVVQLLFIGYVLAWVFAHAYWYVVLPIMLLMTLIAGLSAGERAAMRYPGQTLNSIVSICVGAWSVAAIGLVAVIRIEPWYEPQYAIPILGMILGNTLTGISLAMERMIQELTSGRGRVELILSLGGTRWEGAHQAARNAIRAGMMPTLNQMSVVGLVSLPGMMTGQVLAGESPMAAVRYQIVIMFLIAAASALGTACAVLLTYRRLFSADHQFMSERLVERR